MTNFKKIKHIINLNVPKRKDVNRKQRKLQILQTTQSLPMSSLFWIEADIDTNIQNTPILYSSKYMSTTDYRQFQKKMKTKYMQLSTISPNIKYTIEVENNNKINTTVHSHDKNNNKMVHKTNLFGQVHTFKINLPKN